MKKSALFLPTVALVIGSYLPAQAGRFSSPLSSEASRKSQPQMTAEAAAVWREMKDTAADFMSKGPAVYRVTEPRHFEKSVAVLQSKDGFSTGQVNYVRRDTDMSVVEGGFALPKLPDGFEIPRNKLESPESVHVYDGLDLGMIVNREAVRTASLARYTFGDGFVVMKIQGLNYRVRNYSRVVLNHQFDKPLSSVEIRPGLGREPDYMNITLKNGDSQIRTQIDLARFDGTVIDWSFQAAGGPGMTVYTVKADGLVYKNQVTFEKSADASAGQWQKYTAKIERIGTAMSDEAARRAGLLGDRAEYRAVNVEYAARGLNVKRGDIQLNRSVPSTNSSAGAQ